MSSTRSSFFNVISPSCPSNANFALYKGTPGSAAGGGGGGGGGTDCRLGGGALIALADVEATADRPVATVGLPGKACVFGFDFVTELGF
jgi:hypothetical protein